jgi:homoserine dehydrogenase
VVTNTRATFNDTNTTPTINTTAIDAESTEETIKLLKDLGETQTANILVEAIPSNPKSNGEPAISFIRTALQAGMHVASANKCPLSHKNSDRNDGETYFELQKIAKNSRKLYLHESAVMDGVPVFSLWNTLPCVRCTKIRGLFNSTTTLILSRMEGNIDKVVEGDGQIEHHGETFDEAFQAAKQMGIVEEDESLDIDGYDAAMKLRALCVFLGSLSEEYDLIIPPLEAIPRDTIRRIDTDRIYDEFGMSRKKMRSVASAELFDVSSDPANGLHRPVKTWKMCVKNEFLSPSDTLYNMKGTSSSVQFYTDTMGPITIVSTDPTLKDTAYGLFSDIVRIASQSLY